MAGWSKLVVFVALFHWTSAVPAELGTSKSNDSAARYVDGSAGKDWPGYGRTFGEQHYSPLEEINQSNVRRLGLAWSMDLGPENSVTQPIAVDGVLYFATGYSVVHAVQAATGKLLWRYDPRAPEVAGLNLRFGYGSRGIAWWNGRIFTGTQDGRLIAIDAKNGLPLWSVQTFDKSGANYITGAPRVFDGKVIIGFSSDTGANRGYVTTYDAQTGRQLWRFYTVPGDPARGLENDAMAMAAKTWSGEWWKFGGGGAVWNAMAYDPQTDSVYIGTGNGYPINRRARSQDAGDNLFIASIVALEGKSGAYKWHYQLNPGDTWDFDATMDIELADLTIEGRRRKVLMQAPKNGFFYVIDRITGKLISAEPYTNVTWATRIDLSSGRPIERPEARYPNGASAQISPSVTGAHNWQPMAFSPKRQLVYIPVIEESMQLDDKGVDMKNWTPPLDRAVPSGWAYNISPAGRSSGALLAWNPITEKAAWRVPYPTRVNGGVLATAGDLVFQGTVDGAFKSYAADTGKLLWSFDSKAPLIAPPISYISEGRQYVTVLTGLGGIAGIGVAGIEKFHVDPRSQARRVITFSLDGKATLPDRMPEQVQVAPAEDAGLDLDTNSADGGQVLYNQHCFVCHGLSAVSTTHAPDLRRSIIPSSAVAFSRVVRDGALEPHGMPKFGEFNEVQLGDLRRYILIETAKQRGASH